MREFKMEMDNLRGKWAYLSDENSALYERFKSPDGPLEETIKSLLVQLARISFANHCNSRY